MNVTLIPFFLAASINVNENDWKYGPEVIYNVTLESMYSRLAMHLHCREITNATLRCYFSEMDNRQAIKQIRFFDQEEKHTDAKWMRIFSENDIFELHYNIDGLASIVASSTIDRQKNKIIKAIVSLLNVGTMDGLMIDLSDILTKVSAVDTWKAVCIVPEKKDSTEQEVYNDLPILTIFPGKKKTSDDNESGIIDETPNFKTCRAWVFHRSYNPGRPFEDTNTFKCHYMTSGRRMLMTKHHIKSYTENEYEINGERASAPSYLDKILLVFDKIVPASGPMPMINGSRINLCT